MSQVDAVRIVRAPVGEAPVWVRQAWIGLTLPLAPGVRPGQRRAAGVLSGPHSFLGFLLAWITGRTEKVEGYPVLASEAVRQLSLHNPEAASWWHEHAPHVLGPRRVFLFDTLACEPIET
jgi:hypothetical protein